MAIKRLGTLLVEEQLITEEQLQRALARQKQSGEQLGESLVSLGAITEESLYRFLAIQHGLEFSAINGRELSNELIKLVPANVAWKYRAIPLAQDNGSLVMATSQPDDLSLFYLPKELKLPADVRLKVVVAPGSEVSALLEKHFPQTDGRAGGEIQIAGAGGSVKTVGKERERDANQMAMLEATAEELMNADDVDLQILEDQRKDEEDEGPQDEGPIIKLCDFIIMDAVRKRASDIHMTPYERKIVLKYRIDGSLIEFASPPVSAKNRLATRFKIMTKTMNIIEKRRPQDGRISLTVAGRPIDIRISTLPTNWGENIVMRIVDQSNAILDLSKLGMEPDQFAQFKKAITQPYGMVFVTGPTGSGKTSTLFAALNEVNTPTKNIMTVEDPVEFRLPHIIQIQVEPNVGRSFASVLRAFLRHDPNIMLVGEIRDSETATISLQASLTGHMVLSSLHTNDAASAVMRLIDLGLDPVYIGTSVLCICSQRLVRRICDKCKQETQIPEEELKRIGLKTEDLKGQKFFKGKGCSECHNSGYRGRLAVFEVLPISASIRELIYGKATLAQLKSAAKEAGYKSIREAALVKWRAGDTTLEEVLGETFE